MDLKTIWRDNFGRGPYIYSVRNCHLFTPTVGVLIANPEMTPITLEEKFTLKVYFLRAIRPQDSIQEWEGKTIEASTESQNNIIAIR
eukprot:scaffold1559_cov114-Cylindrotheca_fusiformis.AAC.2